MSNVHISNIDFVRAWKDADYRNSLCEEQKALLPDNPAGDIDLTDLNYEQLDAVVGGAQLPLFTEGRCLTIQGAPSQCGGGCVPGFTQAYATCGRR
jgi:mersacidin/lichenicidin family type 2 lantibiotic